MGRGNDEQITRVDLVLKTAARLSGPNPAHLTRRSMASVSGDCSLSCRGKKINRDSLKVIAGRGILSVVIIPPYTMFFL